MLRGPARPCVAILREALAAFALLAVLAATPPKAAKFDPVAFFTGKTRGSGMLTKFLSGTRRVSDSNVGTVREDGMLVLDQTVDVVGEKVRIRKWQLRETAPGQFTGTLSDANGPVTAKLTDTVLRITYTLTEGNMAVEQVITLLPDGQSAHNVMKVRRLGITFATLEGTIRKETP